MQKVSEKINDETPFAITLKPLTSLEPYGRVAYAEAGL